MDRTIIKNLPTSSATFSFDDILKFPAVVLDTTDPNLLTPDNIKELMTLAVYAAAEEINPLKRQHHMTSPLLNPKTISARSPSAVTMYINQELSDDTRYPQEELEDQSTPLFGMEDTQISSSTQQYNSNPINEIPTSSQTSLPLSTPTTQPEPQNQTQLWTNDGRSSFLPQDELKLDPNLTLDELIPTIHSSIQQLERKWNEYAMRAPLCSRPMPTHVPDVHESVFDATTNAHHSGFLQTLDESSFAPILPLSTLTLPVSSPNEQYFNSFDELKLLQQPHNSSDFVAGSKWEFRPNDDHLHSTKRAPYEHWSGETFEVPCQRWDPTCSRGVASSFFLTCSLDCGIWSTQLALRLNISHSDLMSAMLSTATANGNDGGHIKFDRMFPKHAGSNDRWIMADRLVHLFHHLPTYMHMINQPAELGHRLCSAIRAQLDRYPVLTTPMMACQAEHDLLMAKCSLKSVIGPEIRSIKSELSTLQTSMKNLQSRHDEQRQQSLVIQAQINQLAQGQLKLMQAYKNFHQPKPTRKISSAKNKPTTKHKKKRKTTETPTQTEQACAATKRRKPSKARNIAASSSMRYGRTHQQQTGFV